MTAVRSRCQLLALAGPLFVLAIQTGDQGTAAVFLGLAPILAVLALLWRGEASTSRLERVIAWVRRRLRRSARSAWVRPVLPIPVPRFTSWTAASAHTPRGPPA